MLDFWNAVVPCSKQQRIMLGIVVCLLVITLLELQLIDMMTVHYASTGRISGNGNLGLLAVGLFIPFYFMLLSCIGIAGCFVYYNRLRQKKSNCCFLVFLVGVSIGLGLIQRFFFMRERIPEDVQVETLWDYLLTPYMNSAFVNIFTYLLGIIFTIVLSYIIALILYITRMKKKELEKTQEQAVQ